MSKLKSFSCILYYLFLASSHIVFLITMGESRHTTSRTGAGATVASVSRTEEMQLDRELASRIEELTNHWTCSSPKPRLVYVIEENPSKLTPYTQWIPPVAVLHRCEQHLGCCLNHPEDTCRPLNTTQVSILFKQRNVLTNEQTYERLTFTNHTECGCLSETSLSSSTTSTTSSSSLVSTEVNLSSTTMSSTTPMTTITTDQIPVSR